ncbi:hypothetical protein CK203_044045 [Vitis vinifera]|uniref:Uncharacterized protein n=1 Tax=Vitis vinifera TaxID=29760 RepID=A0A438HLX2_VITVI|nr:hypothetical protein CK203_044045 [Vitis vinifera]
MSRVELSSWGAWCMGVCRSCGLTLHVSGIAPAVLGYIDSGSGLEFATWPLDADDGEAPSIKPGCATQHFLLSILLSPGGELVFVARLPTIFSRWLGAIQNYLPLP